ncbi:Rne/Rng family ribonuclease [Psychrobacter sp. I-STPA10]|uniref:Rne/Rng family ribonuclease n=1 Tax=Psychrobacter sp. I-STPA10 TaxID=2585769 RepID=UPI001E449D3C|nr:Rne/Rng family ribonuclease [Psychrobacter sp. I-STPA10]
MKRILINATHNEEIRVALCKDNHLYDFDLENRTREQKKANIYKGHVTRVEPSLEAVFVEYGSQRQGFLPVREIANEYLTGNPRDENIKKLIKEGDELIVQVEKEERGNKGAALSTYVSLAGRYLVLMPNNPRGGGISRQISGKLREDMKRMLSNLELPKGMSVIIRTAGIGKSQDELQHDLNHLLNIWNAIQEQNKKYPSPRLVHQEAGVVTRAVRDYLRDDISEIWIDNENAYNEAANFVKAVMPRQIEKLRKYTDYEPMFANFGIEKQIETAYQREVRLPSGGSIVIDQTEALVSIDINSAKSTKGSDVAETAYHTNLEAADEIARQLRLRDMGGLIVIDFIDMNDSKHQRDVEKRLIDATKYDRARVQFGGISKFGLMEMSRQRLRPSLEESTGYICPRCHGNGMIRDLRSLSLSIMRQIEQIALKERQGEVQAEVPTDIAAFLLNEKRDSLVYLEQDSGTRITILPHAHLESPNFKLHFNRDGFAPSSYERISDTQQQESSELGYDVNWQTAETERPEQQPVRQPHSSTNKQTTTDKNQTAVQTPVHTSEPQSALNPSTPVSTPTATSGTPTNTTANTQPQHSAVAWLSNLFAPAPQAQTEQNISSQAAAQAIESIVNTGAQSLGVFGQVANTAVAPTQKPQATSTETATTTSNNDSDTLAAQQAEEAKEEQNRRQRRSRHNANKNSKAKNRQGKPQGKSSNSAQSRGQKDESTQQENTTAVAKSSQQETHSSHEQSKKELPKRSAHSKRDSRGSIERSETLTERQDKNQDNQQQKEDKHINKSSQNNKSSRDSGASNPNEINIRISESPLSLKEPEVVHLSLDDEPVKHSAKETKNNAKAELESDFKTDVKSQAVTEEKTVAGDINDTNDSSNNEITHDKVASQEKTSIEVTDTDTTITHSNNMAAQEEQPETQPKQVSNSSATEDSSIVTTVTTMEADDTQSISYDIDTLFADRYVTAKQYGKASNDPRVVRAKQSNLATTTTTATAESTDVEYTKKLSITGNVGEFIQSHLPDADTHISSQGVIVSFIKALSHYQAQKSQAMSSNVTSQSSADITQSHLQSEDSPNGMSLSSSFSNYGYQPLAEDYLSRFDKMTTAVAKFATKQGKTTVQPTAVSQRAKNDPRGQHPDYQAKQISEQTTVHDMSVTDTSLQSSSTITENEAQPTDVQQHNQNKAPNHSTHSFRESIGEFIVRMLGQQGQDLLKAGQTELAFLQASQQPIETIEPEQSTAQQVSDNNLPASALAPEEQVNSVEQESEQILETTTESTTSDNTEPQAAIDSSDTSDNNKTAAASKTSVESYKSMIENVSEQLLPQMGLLNLTAAKVTPKAINKASKVPKSRSRKPKAEHKKPTQSEQQDETNQSETEAEDNNKES